MPKYDRYILLMPIEAETLEARPRNIEGAQAWLVGEAAPQSGSTVERQMPVRSIFIETDSGDDKTALEAAVAEAFDRMRRSGLPGVLDAGELRLFEDTPLGFCQSLTEHIHEDLPDTDAEDFRVDDFDNHPLSELREAMVDRCPEYHGEAPEMTL